MLQGPAVVETWCLITSFCLHSTIGLVTTSSSGCGPFMIHPLDISKLLKMTGIEYVLSEVMEPHLFVIRKQKRDSLDKVTPIMSYYLLDGSIYQAPLLCNIFAARIASFSSLLSLGRALYYIQKAFTIATSKLVKIGYVDAENEGATLESKVTEETIDFKEGKRVDHILPSLQHKLPPAPTPPPFPEGYTPTTTAEAETGPETQQTGEPQPPPVDPIIDQGPAKRMKF